MNSIQNKPLLICKLPHTNSPPRTPTPNPPTPPPPPNPPKNLYMYVRQKWPPKKAGHFWSLEDKETHSINHSQAERNSSPKYVSFNNHCRKSLNAFTVSMDPMGPGQGGSILKLTYVKYYELIKCNCNFLEIHLYLIKRTPQ